MTATHRAAIAREYGPPTVLEVVELPAPTPGPGQVLVRVRAASMNPLDTKLRAGAFRPFLRLKFPAVLGFDFAGEIEAVGQDVSGFQVATLVYGRTDATTGGTHGERTAVAAGVIDRIPSNLSFEEAASLPLAAMSAIQALETVELEPGQRLLVVGAAGGVGTAAVQVGRAMGAQVTGVCSTDSAPLVEGLGARVLDYTKGELDATGERFDVVFDTVFDRSWRYYRRFLTPRGEYVTTGFSPTLAIQATVGRLWSRRSCHLLMSRADGRLMRRLSDFVEAGELTAIIDSTFPLDRIADAHRRVEQGHLRGKVVVTIA